MQQQLIRRPESSHVTRGIIVNKYGGQWTNPSILTNISLWYQDVEVSKDF